MNDGVGDSNWTTKQERGVGGRILGIKDRPRAMHSAPLQVVVISQLIRVPLLALTQFGDKLQGCWFQRFTVMQSTLRIFGWSGKGFW